MTEFSTFGLFWRFHPEVFNFFRFRYFATAPFYFAEMAGFEQGGTAAGGANNSPVGCCLVRGSQRIGMSKGVGCRSEGHAGLELKTYKVLIAESLLP